MWGRNGEVCGGGVGGVGKLGEEEVLGVWGN